MDDQILVYDIKIEYTKNNLLLNTETFNHFHELIIKFFELNENTVTMSIISWCTIRKYLVSRT